MSQYDESSIQRLHPMDHVRRRPGMYIGGTDHRALHQLIFLAIEDIFLVGLFREELANRIEVKLFDDYVITIQDNGDGISIQPHQWGVRRLEICLLAMGQRISWLSTVNALSEWFKVEVRRDGYLWEQGYERGKKVTEVTQVRPLDNGEAIGTTITFKPDFSILEENEFDYTALGQRFNEIAAIKAGLTITLRDERTNFPKRENTFHYPNRLAGFVEYLNHDHKMLHPVVYAEGLFDLNGWLEKMQVEIAFQYVDHDATIQLSYANLIQTDWHGSHLRGLMNALEDYLFQTSHLLPDHVVPGLTAVVRVEHENIPFGNSIKRLIDNDEIETAVFDLTMLTLARFAETNPDDMQRIIDKCLANKKARESRLFTE